MIVVPKWDKRNNQRKLINHFYKLLYSINRVKKIKANSSPKGTKTKPSEQQATKMFLNNAKRKPVELPGSCFFA